MVEQKNYSLPPYNRKEILRYAGMREPLPEVEELLDACLEELSGKIAPRVCWAEFPLKESGGELDLSFARTASLDLRKTLKGSLGIVVFGATIGLETDRLIARYARISPAKALIFQAIGAERIEALCDLFQNEIEQKQNERGRSITPRFSPGYGDLPMELQKEIFRVLDCQRRIGLTLNQSLLMTPAKSVTAIIGIGGYPENR